MTIQHCDVCRSNTPHLTGHAFYVPVDNQRIYVSVFPAGAHCVPCLQWMLRTVTAHRSLATGVIRKRPVCLP